MKYAICLAALIILTACAPEPTPIPKQWQTPVRVVTLEVTIDENQTADDCKNNGGMWIMGETKSWLGVIRGCVKNTESGQK